MLSSYFTTLDYNYIVLDFVSATCRASTFCPNNIRKVHSLQAIRVHKIKFYVSPWIV